MTCGYSDRVPHHIHVKDRQWRQEKVSLVWRGGEVSEGGREDVQGREEGVQASMLDYGPHGDHLHDLRDLMMQTQEAMQQPTDSVAMEGH